MEKSEYEKALRLLIDVWEFNEHDACGCMGPQKGHELCHCQERVIVLRYMKEALEYVTASRSSVAEKE